MKLLPTTLLVGVLIVGAVNFAESSVVISPVESGFSTDTVCGVGIFVLDKTNAMGKESFVFLNGLGVSIDIYNIYGEFFGLSCMNYNFFLAKFQGFREWVIWNFFFKKSPNNNVFVNNGISLPTVVSHTNNFSEFTRSKPPKTTTNASNYYFGSMRGKEFLPGYFDLFFGGVCGFFRGIGSIFCNVKTAPNQPELPNKYSNLAEANEYESPHPPHRPPIGRRIIVCLVLIIFGFNLAGYAVVEMKRGIWRNIFVGIGLLLCADGWILWGCTAFPWSWGWWL